MDAKGEEKERKWTDRDRAGREGTGESGDGVVLWGQS